jgi:hypothetical protein
MLKRALIGLAVLLAVLVAVIATRPSEFQVSRSTTIAAPAPAVFALVDDFRRWGAWSPYEKLDPAMTKTYAGAARGMGAIYTWSGNAEAGEGRATIVESRPNELVRIQLDFVRPMVATSFAEFWFRADGDRTRVTWSLAGTNGFVAKAIHLVLDMDKLVGGQFEQGLSDLKKAVETKP